MPVKKIDKSQQVRKSLFLECLMYEAMAADKSLCLWTSPFSSETGMWVLLKIFYMRPVGFLDWLLFFWVSFLF